MKDNKIKKANTSPEGQAGSENMSTADVDAVMKKFQVNIVNGMNSNLILG